MDHLGKTFFWMDPYNRDLLSAVITRRHNDSFFEIKPDSMQIYMPYSGKWGELPNPPCYVKDYFAFYLEELQVPKGR